MAKTSYISIDGMLIGEETSGVVRNYLPDALGSVVETVSNGVEENTYVYKPYGATLAKTGTAADPSFLWNGGSGYRATNTSFAESYVRRRHYSSNTARWTTSDLLWPQTAAYLYAEGDPIRRTDPSGLFSPPGGGLLPWPSKCCSFKRTVSQTFQNSAGARWGKTVITSSVYWQVQRASKNQSTGPVAIKWEEKSNVLPYYYPSGSRNRWIDATHIGPTSFPNLYTDQAKCVTNGCPATPCDGNSWDVDPPTYTYEAALPLVRCACFRLTVFSQCNTPATVYKWSQTVSFQFVAQSIYIPLVHAPSDPITDGLYCSQPDGVDCPQTAR